MTVYLALLLAGVASGFLAGLLGIGGGFVMVPVLILLLPMLGIDPGVVAKVAVATSLAAMIPTACSAVVAQYRRGTLDVVWVRRLAPAAAIGATIGSQVAAAANGRWVAMVFARLIGSCSTGSATAVDNRTREVTAAAVARLTHGSSVRM